MFSYKSAKELIRRITTETRHIAISHRAIIRQIVNKMEACICLDDKDRKRLRNIEKCVCKDGYECVCKKEDDFFKSGMNLNRDNFFRTKVFNQHEANGKRFTLPMLFKDAKRMLE